MEKALGAFTAPVNIQQGNSLRVSGEPARTGFSHGSINQPRSGQFGQDPSHKARTGVHARRQIARGGHQVPHRLLNTSDRQARNSLDKLIEMGHVTILPGHGNPWTGEIAEAVEIARDDFSNRGKVQTKTK